MEGSSGLSASDVLALTRDNDNGFLGGNAGGILALIIVFILLFGGNNMWGNNNNSFALADLQASLYNQTQDANSRALAQGQCNLTDTVLNASYNNLLATKDIQNQISNSVAGITNQIANQTSTILGAMNENVINDLRDKLAVTRDELSNTRQTAEIVGAINAQTSNILNAQGKYYLNPPCYQGCGCGCNGLY